MPIKLLSFATLKKHWALAPVVVICGTAVVMCASYVTHMCLHKTDLSWNPRSWKNLHAPYQTVEPHEIKKFIKHHKANVYNEEIEALKRELGSFKS